MLKATATQSPGVAVAAVLSLEGEPHPWPVVTLIQPRLRIGGSDGRGAVGSMGGGEEECHHGGGGGGGGGGGMVEGGSVGDGGSVGGGGDAGGKHAGSHPSARDDGLQC